MPYDCRSLPLGGTHRQIVWEKAELAPVVGDREKWRKWYILVPRAAHDTHTRAGVYQALPGPEATELACYFGLIAKGYFAAFLGGFGFILPGFLIMLLFSYIYGRFNLFQNPVRA